MQKPILSLNDIHFSYDEKRWILNGVTFDVFKKEYICIVGHNGSGKSTISKVVSGLVKPQKGKILIGGHEVTSKNIQMLRKKIGVIFQNPDNQFIGITAEDDIAFGLENYNVDPSMMQTIINNTANIIDITHILKKESFDLSGGQKQKVAISSVLALTPEIIIFDESTSMLDPKAKMQIKKLMKYLQREYGRTIISITHDMEELKNSSRILCMYKGEVARIDKLKHFVKDYEFLVNNSLSLPDNLELCKKLNDSGLKVEPSLSLDKLVGEICK
ncbi:MAG: ATP-binding cassette domain-containing protein [Mycoplasma sp.]